MHLATVLRSEVNTLAYPDAALFGSSIGLLLYNVLAFLEAALRTAHRRKLSGRSLSMYYLADEISGVYRGMMIAIPPPHWTTAYATLSPGDFADQTAITRQESGDRSLPHQSTFQEKTSPQTPKRLSRKSRLHIQTLATKKSNPLASKPSASAPGYLGFLPKLWIAFRFIRRCLFVTAYPSLRRSVAPLRP